MLERELDWVAWLSSIDDYFMARVRADSEGAREPHPRKARREVANRSRCSGRRTHLVGA